MPFDEVRVNEGDLATVMSGTSLYDANQVVGRITYIPVCMVCPDEFSEALRDTLEHGSVRNKMQSHCQKRSFELLPGFVDIDVISVDKLSSMLPETL